MNDVITDIFTATRVLYPETRKPDPDKALADFGRELAANQEPLGREFAEVLAANLPDLYLRSEPEARIPETAMPTVTLTADKLRDLRGAAGYDARSYSGRGMYGKECVGVVTDDQYKSVLAGLTYECEDVTQAADVIRFSRTDSMGTSIVVYWPKCEWVDL